MSNGLDEKLVNDKIRPELSKVEEKLLVLEKEETELRRVSIPRHILFFFQFFRFCFVLFRFHYLSIISLPKSLYIYFLFYFSQ